MRTLFALLLALAGGLLFSMPSHAQMTPFAHWCGISTTRVINFAHCWGGASSGRLGNGTTAPDLSFLSLVVGPPGGFTDWTTISAGAVHTCGIRAGQVYCWGNASFGRLGNGTTTPNRTTPSLVLGGFTDWTAISGGNAHTCGIRAGQAYCWGWASSGRLGNGTTTPNRTTPSLVLGGFTDWTAISAGSSHTCGIRAGQAYCWGAASAGQLGNGTTTPDQTTPSLVMNLGVSWTAISSVSDHSCGIISQTQVGC